MTLTMLDSHARSSDMAGMYRDKIFFLLPNLRMRYFRPKSWRPGVSGAQGNWYRPVTVHGTSGILDSVQTLANYFARTDAADYSAVSLESEAEQMRPAWYSLKRTSRPPSFKPIGADTIRNEIKREMQEAGIDISRFQTHANRGASASKAATLAVLSDAEDELLNSIVSTATWAKRQTYEQSYAGEIEGLNPEEGKLHFDSLQHALRYGTPYVPPSRVTREEVETERDDNWIGSKVIAANGDEGVVAAFSNNNPFCGPFRIRFAVNNGADWEFDELLRGISRFRGNEADA